MSVCWSGSLVRAMMTADGLVRGSSKQELVPFLGSGNIGPFCRNTNRMKVAKMVLWFFVPRKPREMGTTGSWHSKTIRTHVWRLRDFRSHHYVGNSRIDERCRTAKRTPGRIR